ncbi:hypothetical protein SMACR_05606 [Sordaria macrospora]|uniref:WGS project CABT00000000 data, contig 2.30 n=2 Tax=Sordaria macrospora TaxID=5147 RepID=F7W557_SORMK|nr:uncharacterized protein SMAC_05606 [Sordaria macrospora k-hell]KAA8630555.1 hypothetical protein SMACR_05606 [Sordaria macrospora]KAH7625506.1 hypothetical protein B0T09DRAFT_352080 [Sordaria sp. MPI-SDFR-AT-0083]WPJ62522.1 hypothetical protein SMAC4_05606 [Sordaria macrospora]CCC12645.1 unnamed protein product [Sordaria macrospora k-hell]
MVHLAETTNPWGGHSWISDSPTKTALPLDNSTLYEKTPSGATNTSRSVGNKLFHSSLFDIGILRDTLLPSLTLHSGLALVAYGAGRYTNRLETKDWLWPSGQVLNAWWSALGKRVICDGIPLSSAWAIVDRPQRLLLTGVTLWGSRLFWRIANRSLKRGSGKDDPRYETTKKQAGWSWNKALFTTYLPEAVFQSLITLPFTAPFRHLAGSDTACPWALSGGYAAVGQAVAVGLFSMGFALEVLADWQLEKFKEKEKEGKESHNAMCREGVWSIVRHPNYLGDMLVHLSFPLLLFASNALQPIHLLGPLTNYIFLRYVSGDKENEHSQARRYSTENVNKKIDFDKYRREENAFWPDKSQVSNKWTWIVVGAGVAGALLEGLVTKVIA